MLLIESIKFKIHSAIDNDFTKCIPVFMVFDKLTVWQV